LSRLPGVSIPKGASASANAIYLEQYCDGAIIRGNTIDSFETAVYLNRNAGLSLGISGLGSDKLISVATPVAIIGPETKVFGEFVGALNLTSLPPATEGKFTIEILVIGARPGDHVMLSAPSSAAAAAVDSTFISQDKVRVIISAGKAADVTGTWSARIVR